MVETTHFALSAAAVRSCALVLVLAGGTGPAQPVHAGADFDHLRGLAADRYGPAAEAAVHQWGELIAALAGLAEREQIRQVNVFFNERVRFESDEAVWGQRDYWATPLETLGRARGDCEDFSVAKYASLRLVGVAEKRLRLVYVKALIGGPDSGLSQAHMVLAYYPAPGAEPLILDNLVSEVRPASRRPDLQPVFSFNGSGLWVGSNAQPADKKPERRLSHWRGVLGRMREEGLR